MSGMNLFCPDKLPLILVVDDDKTMRILLRKVMETRVTRGSRTESLLVYEHLSQILSCWMKM